MGRGSVAMGSPATRQLGRLPLLLVLAYMATVLRDSDALRGMDEERPSAQQFLKLFKAQNSIAAANELLQLGFALRHHHAGQHSDRQPQESGLLEVASHCVELAAFLKTSGMQGGPGSHKDYGQFVDMVFSLLFKMHEEHSGAVSISPRSGAPIACQCESSSL